MKILVLCPIWAKVGLKGVKYLVVSAVFATNFNSKFLHLSSPLVAQQYLTPMHDGISTNCRKYEQSIDFRFNQPKTCTSINCKKKFPKYSTLDIFLSSFFSIILYIFRNCDLERNFMCLFERCPEQSCHFLSRMFHK